jgi:hypothetical protein
MRYSKFYEPLADLVFAPPGGSVRVVLNLKPLYLAAKRLLTEPRGEVFRPFSPKSTC